MSTTDTPRVIPGILSFQDIGAQALKPESGMRGLALVNGAFKGVAPDGTQSTIGGGGGFGSDTIVQLPNSALALVSAVEIVTSLPTGTAGSETSKTIFKNLLAGAQKTSLELWGDHIVVPAGVDPFGAGIAGITFQGNGNGGLWANTADQSVTMAAESIGGASRVFWQVSLTGINTNTVFLGWNTGTSGLFQNTTGELQIFGGTVIGGGADKDLIVGPRASVSAARTGGFLSLPSCVGQPSGVPVILTNFPNVIPLQIDRTGFKLWGNFGGTWKAATFA